MSIVGENILYRKRWISVENVETKNRLLLEPYFCDWIEPYFSGKATSVKEVVRMSPLWYCLGESNWWHMCKHLEKKGGQHAIFFHPINNPIKTVP